LQVSILFGNWLLNIAKILLWQMKNIMAGIIDLTSETEYFLQIKHKSGYQFFKGKIIVKPPCLCFLKFLFYTIPILKNSGCQTHRLGFYF